jgi:hypothetical protein
MMTFNWDNVEYSAEQILEIHNIDIVTLGRHPRLTPNGIEPDERQAAPVR